MAETEDASFISTQKAEEELGVSRTTMRYYIKQLSIEMRKFPLDRKAYIAVADFERIKAMKKAAEEGRR